LLVFSTATAGQEGENGTTSHGRGIFRCRTIQRSTVEEFYGQAEKAQIDKRANFGYCAYTHNGGGSVPRPRKRRNCRRYDGDRVFKPRSIPMTELKVIRLDLDELEALRLCDLEGYEQEAAGARMGISRGTVQRILKSGRAKVVRALTDSSALLIEKGETDEALHSDG
jgi:predicted DNA-binding protein (UPF0251 family)